MGQVKRLLSCLVHRFRIGWSCQCLVTPSMSYKCSFVVLASLGRGHKHDILEEKVCVRLAYSQPLH